MAAGDTEVRIVIDAQGNPSLVKVNKSIEKQSKEIDKNTKTKKKGEQQSKRNQAVEKSLYQTTLNSSKGFSKQARAMGGSSGLVAAYATLAANVFAATAAFSALQKAAQFEQLKKGLTELGHQSGRTLSIMAEGLRNVTGGAISTEEAMRAAALGVSGGFGGEQLEKLAVIAKGASITLGRSLPDAFDRLTRGAIKLEPEILDELGIMVRLDDAVENYGAQIGKAGSALTQMERRQAFMNAIIEQGTAKFGEIADAIEPDVYSQLGATFGDLTKSIFGILNDKIFFGFAGLNDVIKLLANNTTILFGVMTLFASTIAGKMIPALAGGAEAAGHLADKQIQTAVAAQEALEAQRVAAQSTLGASGAKMGPAWTKELKHLDTVKDKKKSLLIMQKSVNASLVRENAIIASSSGQAKKEAVERVAALEAESLALKRNIALETGKTASVMKTRNAIALATAQQTLSTLVQKIANKEMGRGAAWKAIKEAAEAYSIALKKNTADTLGNAAAQTWGARAMRFMKVQVYKLAAAFQVLKLAVIEFIAPIALAIIAIGALVAAWNFFFNFKEMKEYKKGLEDMDKLFGEIEQKVAKYNIAMSNGKALAEGQARAFEIQSGIITELNVKLKEQIKLKKRANEVGRGQVEDTLTEGQGKAFVNRFMSEEGDLLKEPTGRFREWGHDFKDMMIGNMEGIDREMMIPLAQISTSSEFKTFANIMNDGIPGHALFMKDRLLKIMNDPEIKTSAQRIAAFAQGVQAADDAFGALGPNTTAFGSALKETNKSASQFITGFAKKTKVDDFSRSLQGSVKALDDMKASAKDAYGETEEGAAQTAVIVGKALLQVDKQMGQMIGGGFIAAQKELIAAGRALSETSEGTPEYATAVVNLHKANMEMASFEGQYRQLNIDVAETQKLTLLTKTAIDGVNKALQFTKKHYKVISGLAGKTNKLTEKRLKLEQKLNVAQFKQGFKMFDSLKVSKEAQALSEKELKDTIGMQDLLTLSAEARNQILKDNVIDEQLYNSLLQGNLEIQLRELEIKRTQDKVEEDRRKDEIDQIKERLKLEEKIRKIKMQSDKIDIQMSNFNRMGTTSLNAKQEAEFKVRAAKEEAMFAIENARLEKELIDIKGRMQLIDIQILNKQLKLYNQMDGLKKGDEGFLQGIDEDKAEKDIKLMADLQKKAYDDNTEFLKKKVVLASMEGANSILEAIQSGDLFAGEGMGGISDMFKEMSRGELALKDTKAADDYYARSKKKGSNSVHDHTNEAINKQIHEAIVALPDQLAGIVNVEHLIDKSPMGQLTDNFLNNLDLSIDMSGIMKEVAKNVEGRADPWINLPPSHLINLMDKGQTGTGAGWNEDQFKRLTEESLDSFFIKKAVETEARRYSEGTGDTKVMGDDPYNISKDQMTSVTAHEWEGPSLDIPKVTEDIKENGMALINWREVIMQTQAAIAGLGGSLADFGEEGEAMMSFRGGMANMMGAMLAFKEASGEDALQQRLAATAAFIGGIGQMIQADAKQSVARIDMLIDAETKKDGKSKESLAKIKGMEGKKLAIQKKAFETNKKMKIAETVIATGSAAMKAYESFAAIPIVGPALGAAMAAMVIAMGMKQVSMISSQQFNGGSANMDAGAPAKISVGKRSNRVDTAQRVTSGELAYLRGERGIGTNANNFQAQGGAAGLRKGYADGGVVVGERGPEVIEPLTGFNVVPNDALRAKNVVNASFTIHAVDAAGVEEVLMGQQGHIINMIRSAANENGEEFLESIDTQTYGNPQSEGGIDY